MLLLVCLLQLWCCYELTITRCFQTITPTCSTANVFLQSLSAPSCPMMSCAFSKLKMLGGFQSVGSHPAMAMGMPHAAIFASHSWVKPASREIFSCRTSWLLPIVASGTRYLVTRVTRPCFSMSHEKSERFRFLPSLLDRGTSSIQEALSYAADSHVYMVRSFGRSSSFRRMTCGLLERLLPNLKSSRLILAVDDPDIDSYKANAGPWSGHIIMGVKGAERQIAFIDQIFPKGPRLSSAHMS